MTTLESTKTFNKFYTSNKRQLQNFIFKMVHNVEIAEELVNDSFVKAYQNMHKFDETKATLKTWIYNIATNTTIDYLRKAKLNTLSMYGSLENNDGEVLVMDFESSEATPLEALIRAESESKIKDKMQNLSAQESEILTKLTLGYSYNEIAEEMALPLGTVKGAIHLARLRMKSYFNKPVLA